MRSVIAAYNASLARRMLRARILNYINHKLRADAILRLEHAHNIVGDMFYVIMAPLGLPTKESAAHAARVAPAQRIKPTCVRFIFSKSVKADFVCCEGVVSTAGTFRGF
jgi:hypothetical protein